MKSKSRSIPRSRILTPTTWELPKPKAISSSVSNREVMTRVASVREGSSVIVKIDHPAPSEKGLKEVSTERVETSSKIGEVEALSVVETEVASAVVREADSVEETELTIVRARPVVTVVVEVKEEVVPIGRRISSPLKTSQLLLERRKTVG